MIQFCSFHLLIAFLLPITGCHFIDPWRQILFSLVQGGHTTGLAKEQQGTGGDTRSCSGTLHEDRWIITSVSYFLYTVPLISAENTVWRKHNSAWPPFKPSWWHCRSVSHNFGPEWNIIPLTVPLAPPWGWHLWIWVNYLLLLDGLSQKYTYSCTPQDEL